MIETDERGQICFLDQAKAELLRARAKHAPINSAHEGFAVLLEEVDELKAEVWKKREERDLVKMRDELIQVAAMAARMAEDTGLIAAMAPDSSGKGKLRVVFTVCDESLAQMMELQRRLRHAELAETLSLAMSILSAAVKAHKDGFKRIEFSDYKGNVRSLLMDLNPID